MSPTGLEYFCNVPSLYQSLDDKSIQTLEEAIKLGRLGFYDEALSIINSELSSDSVEPVVLYEKAALFWLQGKVRDVHQVLAAFLESCDAKDLDLPAHRLLALVLAFAEVFHRGQLGRAVKELDRTRKWLWDVPIPSYTDVQVSVLGWFCMNELLVSLTSNQSQHENCLIPKLPGGPRTPWAGFTELREHLLSAGRINEAFQAVRRTNPKAYSYEALASLYRDTLARIPETSTDAKSRQKLALIRANLGMGLLEMLIEAKLFDQANTEFARAWSHLMHLQACFGSELPAVSCTSLYVRFRQARIHVLPQDDFETRYSRNMSIIQDAKVSRHRDISSCYLEAAQAARAMYQKTGREIWRERLSRLFEEKEEREFEVNGDIFTPLKDHWESIPDGDGEFVTKSSDEVRSIAEWYERYERDHPNFDVPWIANLAANLKLRLYVSLEDFSGMLMAAAAIEKWAPKLPTALPAKPATTEGEFAKQDVSGRYSQVEDERRDPGESSGQWFQAISDLTDEMERKGATDPFWSQGFPGQALLAQWIKDDYRSGRLSLEELEEIFAPGDTRPQGETGGSTSSLVVPLPLIASALRFDYVEEEPVAAASSLDSDLPSVIQGLSGSNISERLLGPYTQEISNHLWARKQVALKAWLRQPSKIPQVRKDFVLLCVYWMRAKQFGPVLSEHVRFDKSLSNPAHEWQFMREIVQRHRDCIAVFDASDPELRRSPARMGLKMQDVDKIAEFFMAFTMSATVRSTSNLEEFWNDEVTATLEEVIETSSELIRHYETQSLWENVAICRVRLGVMLLLKLLLGLAPSVKESEAWRNSGLRLLEQADDFFSSKLRRQRGASVIESLWRKEDSRSWGPAWLIPLAALRLLKYPHGFTEPEFGHVWKWIQRSKAKALQSVIDWRCREGLSHIHSDQKDATESITLADLETMAKSSGVDSVTFIDWFSVMDFPSQPYGQIHIAVVKPGGEITILDTGMTDREVLELKGTRLAIEDNPLPVGRDLEVAMCVERKQSPLHKLKRLVWPLWMHTTPGDLLVFCPSNYIHQIPLHAMELPDRTVLIHRNPVVHCYSLALLRYNFIRATGTDHGEDWVRIKAATIFGDIAKGEPFEAGRQAVRQLGEFFDTMPFLGTRATKSALLEAAPRSSLLHFHTHVGSLDANPLGHSIVLCDDPQPSPKLMPETITRHPWSALMFRNASYSDYLNTVKNEYITAGEISNLVELPSPSHVTLIACGGARLRVHPGDEVMGIIPAFMMKGATSAVGTLWNTNDGVGASFTRWFYKYMREESEKATGAIGTVGIGNMAKAFQSAMVALDREGGYSLPPYWWAGFVFHGWWMHKPPRMPNSRHPWLTDKPFHDFF